MHVMTNIEAHNLKLYGSAGQPGRGIGEGFLVIGRT